MNLFVIRSDNRMFVDATHQNPILKTVTLVLLAITTLALCFRLLARFYLRENRDFALDDGIIICSYIFGLGQSVTLLDSRNIAFGTARNELEIPSLERGMKEQYAGNLLFVMSLFFAKISVCAGLLAISPVYKRYIHAISAIILCWAITSLLAQAFQCHLPRPWDYINETCANRAAISRYVSITNIITDGFLVALPVFIVIPLQMPLVRRLAIISLFLVRVITIAATSVQLAFIPRQFGSDFTLSAFPYIICTQVVQCCSISAACVTYIWPLLKSLQSGLIWADHTAANSANPTVNSRTWPSGTHSGSSHRDTGNDGYIEITTLNTVQREPADVTGSKADSDSITHTYRRAW